jgi:protein-L-isoaspartate(D-aspartate) O-methyltransferase
MILPLGDAEQALTIVTRHGDSFEQEAIEPALFVPFLPGVVR